MKADISIPEGSEIKNLTAPRGAEFPANPNDAELFFLTSGEKSLYVYRTNTWVNLIKGGMIIEFIEASAPVNHLLPNADLFSDIVYRIKRIDATFNDVTVTPIEGQLLDGETSFPLLPYEALTLLGHEGNWYIL